MKNAKRIVAIVLTFAMVMALGITAFAEQSIGSELAMNNGNGKIVVTGGEEFKEKTIVAVRFWDIADLGDNDNGDSVIDPNEKPNYDIVNDWIYSGAGVGNSFFYYGNYGQNFGGGVADNPTFPVVRSFERLMSLDPDNNPEDAKILAEFANEAALYYKNHEDGFDKTGDGQVVYTAQSVPNGDGTYTATIDNAPTGLPYGYYLVFAEGSASGAMLVNVPSDEAEHLQLKSVYPTVDKKADGLDNTSANVGDEVTFTLESTVPNLSGYKVFQFIFRDTISNGLEFVPQSLVVEIKNTENGEYSKVIGTDDNSNAYTVNDYAAGKDLEVAFSDLVKVNVDGADITEGAKIRVTYKAVITEEALSGSAENQATISYSNDPTADDGGEPVTSTPDVVTVYNYSLEIHKFHTNDEDAANRLGGAKFKLKAEDGSYINLVLLEEGGNAYRVATKTENGSWETGSTDEIVTPSEVNKGVLVIKGLEAGTYYLEETEAPEGYNKLKNDLTILIDTTAGYDKDEVVYSVNGTANADPHSNVIGVKNSNGTLLPSTGGIGTIIITVVGVAVVIGGFVLLRKKDDEDTAVKA